jgi:hypothetical protein
MFARDIIRLLRQSPFLDIREQSRNPETFWRSPIF